MNKEWVSQLAGDIEKRHGKEAREKIFGGIDEIQNNPKFLSAWFENFTSGMDKLNDKEFLQQMMATSCPCGGDEAENGNAMKEFYDNSKTLKEFVDLFSKWLHKKYNGDVDAMELRGSLLYLTKPLKESNDAGSCGKGCHCFLARHTENIVQDIFCYCCTIGHTGGMFKAAFGSNIKMEFVESIICGGKNCTMIVHLPEKNTGGIMNMHETHYFTVNKKCPCKIDENIIKQTMEIYNESKDIASFVEELEKRRIKGKKIWFDKETHTIFISKPYACESGGGCPENDTLIGKACHCPHYNHSKECFPKNYCQCGAEYYRPMFEPIFGKKIDLYPFKTVLSGDDECVIAIKIKGEN